MTLKVKLVLMQIMLFVVPVLALAGQIPDTGQTKCYDNDIEIPCPQPGEAFYGQDAQYAGTARSYTKLGQKRYSAAGYRHSGQLVDHDP